VEENLNLDKLTEISEEISQKAKVILKDISIPVNHNQLLKSKKKVE
jgi:hypothetical protein